MGKKLQHEVTIEKIVRHWSLLANSEETMLLSKQFQFYMNSLRNYIKESIILRSEIDDQCFVCTAFCNRKLMPEFKVNKYREKRSINIIVSQFTRHFVLSTLDGACTFPTTWDGTWYDSASSTSDIVFDLSNLKVSSGWTITAYSSTVTSWTCVGHDASSNLILFK